jgi:ribosomal protein S18 acetylase RimI-like enzyme
VTATIVRFEPAAHDPDALIPWVHDAGNPYLDWLFDGEDAARAALREWIERESSEVYQGRATVLISSGEPVGGFYGIPGDELVTCRKADTIALIARFTGAERRDLAARLSSSGALFTAPSAEEYFLSKVGVLAEQRGRGLGEALVESYLEAGAEQGFRRFRLDVHEGNIPAMRLYEKHGFEESGRGATTDGAMTYLSLALET